MINPAFPDMAIGRCHLFRAFRGFRDSARPYIIYQMGRSAKGSKNYLTCTTRRPEYGTCRLFLPLSFFAPLTTISDQTPSFALLEVQFRYSTPTREKKVENDASADKDHCRASFQFPHLLHFEAYLTFLYITNMNKRSLAVLLRARMRPNNSTKLALSPLPNRSGGWAMQPSSDNGNKPQRDFEHVRDSMHSAISMNKTEVIDTVLNDFSEGYFSLCYENRRRLLLVLAKEYDLNRTQVCELIKQYLGVLGEEAQSAGHEEDGVLGSFYRIERNLRHALKPMYEGLFERLNMHPGGLKVLTILRADVLSILAEENIASLRALDSYLKEKLGTWLSPAALELHQITWDDPASLLEKIVAYEAVHPISNLLDLKRRLGVGRRCFGYLHAAIPGEPLIFIEVALLKNVAQTIQEVLWDDPPIPECEATCALFYSISSTQRGLAGINLGKFLIKRVITLVKRDMPHISTFATISPIPGFIQWLLSKLASQSKLAEVEDVSQSAADRSDSAFRENILEPEEEKALMDLSEEFVVGKNGMERMLNLLTSKNHEWSNSAQLLSILKTPLLRLCARYLLQEKKRGKALDSVANFHLQNGAMIERINWMADRSENGLHQSAGIMVNYVYRLENIEEYAQSYFSGGHIHASDDVCCYVEPLNKHQPATNKRG